MQRTKRRSPSDGVALDEDFRPKICPNCGTDRQGPYCHQCGQRYLKDRLTAKELWWLFADRFLDWEEGVWRTFQWMATTPGTVIQHYLGGRRKTYLNPFSYLLFCVALYAFGQLLMRRSAGLAGMPGLKEVQEWGVALNNTEDQFTLIAYGTVAIVALLAVAIRVMFDGRLLNAMEAVVTSIYTSGNVFVLALTFSVLEFIFTGDPLSRPGLVGAFSVLFPVCLAHVGHGLFESWGMALYAAMTPIIALIVGVGVWFVGMGFLAIFIAPVQQGILIGGIALGVLVIPAIAPYLLEVFS